MKIRLFTLPNLLTLSNLMCGALAIVSALVWGDLTTSFWLIAAAAGFDFFDGMVARLMGISGPMGIQLDSLADDISFGLAPSAVLFTLFTRLNVGAEALPEWVGYTVFVFAAFAALRLAKFNIDETQHTEFCGLPTPAATLFVVAIGLISEQPDAIRLQPWMVLATAWVLSLLMVANIRLFALKFKGFGWRGNELRYSFLLLCAALLAVLRLYAIPLIIVLYVLLSIGRALVCARKKEE